MSRESIEWLNANVLMGFVNDREKWLTNSYVVKGEQARPWFASTEFENGYSGPVPIEAVEKLFEWQAIEGPVVTYLPCDMHEADVMGDDGLPMRKVTDPSRKAIIRSDTGDVLNVVSAQYGVHQYSEWLVRNVATILDDDLAIDSAGLLMGGGVAWVSVSLPETIETRAGFPIRPRLLAFTSHNGKFKTTYKRSLEAPVCDNSLDLEIRRDNGKEHEQQWSVRHTSQSGLAIHDARQALGIIYKQTEDMIAAVDALTEWEVSNREFYRLMETLVPMPEPEVSDGKVRNKRAINNAERTRSDILDLYLTDHRAAPWKGTALGVLQAFNTWDQQVRDVRNERVERKLVHTLDTKVAAFDASVLDTLAKVCEREPLVVVS